MARGPRYKVPFRRRREGKTHYYRRKKMILSGTPRLVIRKTNNQIIVQIADAKQKGDRILAQSNSKELRKYGWKFGTNNLPAAYLVGLLIAKKAVNQKFKQVITDFGLHPPNPESRMFATVKGAIDGGLTVNCPVENFPKENRIHGEHIVEFAQIVKKSKKQTFQNQFSSTIKSRLDPETIPANFEEVKNKINAAKVK